MNNKLKKYDKYIKSDVDWLGYIPSDWKVKRLKEVAEINSKTLAENTHPKYEFDYVDISSVTYGVKGFKMEKMTFDMAPSRARRIVKKGDTIISTVRTYLKAVTSIDVDCKDLVVSTGFAVISPQKNVFHKYCSYLLTSDVVINEICAMSKGVSYPAINSSAISDLFFLVPDYETQKFIASYLDTKTNLIDKKIGCLTRKADKYSQLKQSLINEIVTRGLDKNIIMKESRIKWIGEVPEHWKIKRLKELGYLYSGLTGKKGDDFTDEHEFSSNFIPFVNIAKNKSISLHDLKKVIIYPNEIQNKVRKNDLFFLMSSENYEDIGKSSILRENIDNTYLNSFCKGLRITKKNVLPNFINYLLSSDKYRSAISVEGKGFTRINLKIEKINDLLIIIPPYNEQKSIADYLDTKTGQIDHIIETINTQIEKLKELRKTLINDVVTGKIKVYQEGD